MSDSKLLEIKDGTAHDAQLTVLKGATIAGWPEERRKCPPSIQEYWNRRDEISKIEGILFKGEKIIVPQSQRRYDSAHTHRTLGRGKARVEHETSSSGPVRVNQ